MKRCLVLASTPLILATICSSGCAKPTPETEIQTTNYASLIQKLREAGATVEFVSEIRRPEPIFPATGRSFNINGEPLQVYEFQDEATARAEAQKVWPDGSTVGAPPSTGEPGMIVSFNWIAPPHWYQSGNLIAVYVGDNQTIMELLESLLGTQFAGM